MSVKESLCRQDSTRKLNKKLHVIDVVAAVRRIWC